MKIIKFNDGTYGIRRGWLWPFYSYLDMKVKDGYWWTSMEYSGHFKALAEGEALKILDKWRNTVKKRNKYKVIRSV